MSFKISTLKQVIPGPLDVFWPKKPTKSFAAFGLRLVLISCDVKNKQVTTTDTGHYVNIKLLSWILWIWIFMPQLRRITLKLCQVALHIKNSVFIIYLLEDEQELSLGMLIHIQCIYNFLLLHVVILSFLDVLQSFYSNFVAFFGTNILT